VRYPAVARRVAPSGELAVKAINPYRLVPAFFLVMLTSAQNVNVSAAPSQTQIYWGAVVDGPMYGYGSVPHDMRGVLAFESHAGKPVSIIPFGASWMIGGAFQVFDSVGFDNIRNHGSIPLYSWQSNGPNPADFTNARITSGVYDTYIHSWAQAARTWGHPFFLKFDHEMDGSWYPWSEGLTGSLGPNPYGNLPGSYVAMYRHVHDIFTQEGATNVTWVWAVNQENTTGRYPALSELYPGDDYVDWTGIDAYNRFLDHWQTFDMLLTGRNTPTDVANTYQLVLNVAPTKPMMIPEFGVIEDPSNTNAKPAWLRDAYLAQIARNFPAVKAVLYFDWGFRNPEIMIESSPASQAAFANSIALSTYATNTFGQLSTGRITPAAEQVAYLTAVSDTYIAADAPASTTGGSASGLSVNGSATNTRMAYLRFDLASLAGKTIDQAVLQLSTTATANAASSGTFNVKYQANNSLSEQSTSWNSHGSLSDVAPVPIAWLVNPGQLSTTYVAVLSPAFVGAHTGGLLSMQLDTTSTDGAVFAARETTAPELRPQLVIAYR
jgi:mannan endo-1,4-beta-mannosidase